MDSFHDTNASVYSEAKGEYTKQLHLFLVPAFHRFFMKLLKQSETDETNPKRVLVKFQEYLSQIPEWNIDKVQRETHTIIQESNCDYLEELITAVFIAHTKVLSAIRLGSKNKKVQITIPKLEHFLHRALCESSRFLWSSAYLFHNDYSAIEKQKNHRQIEQLLYDGISQAIRGLLPVKNILKDYLAEPDEESDEEAETEEHEEAPVQNIVQEQHVVEALNTMPVQEQQVVEALNATPVQGQQFTEVAATHVQEQLTEIAATPVHVISETVVPVQEQLAGVAQPIIEDLQIPAIVDMEHKQIDLQAKTIVAKPKNALEVTKEDTPVQPVPTIYVDTPAAVQFTDFDQVYGETSSGDAYHHMEYSPKDDDSDSIDDDRIHIVGDADSELSGVEDLDAPQEIVVPMEDGDYEVLE